TLGYTHQLLHLAVHVHSHCYSRLVWLIDLDLLIRRHGKTIDWDELVAVARDEGVGAVLRHALATAHAVLGTPVPALPPPTAGERRMGLCYRRLWPMTKVLRLKQNEHLRLLRFQPGTGDPRDVFYALLLLGRRREKWRALRQRGRHAAQ
ncbi:MAG: nucleotidyltransferase family protein, partial [Chloroflexota bacterium]